MIFLIIHLWLSIASLLGVSDAPWLFSDETLATGKSDEVNCVVNSYEEQNSNILTDGAQLPSGILLSAKDSQQFGNSRPTRSHSFGGGKSNRFSTHWTTHQPYCFSYLPYLSFRSICLEVQRRSASPRLYFVIALRRILC